MHKLTTWFSNLFTIKSYAYVNCDVKQPIHLKSHHMRMLMQYTPLIVASLYRPLYASP